MSDETAPRVSWCHTCDEPLFGCTCDDNDDTEEVDRSQVFSDDTEEVPRPKELENFDEVPPWVMG